jgi:hypothetical protein
MMRYGLALVVVAAVLAMRVPVGAAEAIEGAAALGDEKLTVHLEGVLYDVLERLSKAAKWMVWLEGFEPEDEDGGKPNLTGKATVPVKVDLDKAPLAEIVAAICRQAGLVGEVEGERSVRLWEGDPNVDPRPTARAGDYILRITDISRASEHSFAPVRGKPLPEEPDVAASLTLSLAVTPGSLEADRLLAGIGTEVKVTTDKGGTLAVFRKDEPDDTTVPMQPIYRESDGDQWRGTCTDVPAIVLDEPSPGVRKLTLVEGSLYLYSALKTTALEVSPGDVGRAAKRDDVAVTLSTWKVRAAADPVDGPNTLLVEFDLAAPPLADAAKVREAEGEPLSVIGVFVGKDGTRRTAQRIDPSPPGGAPNTEKVSLQLYLGSTEDAPPELGAQQFEPDHLLLTIVRRGLPDKKLPFVFENVPVP